MAPVKKLCLPKLPRHIMFLIHNLLGALHDMDESNSKPSCPTPILLPLADKNLVTRNSHSIWTSVRASLPQPLFFTDESKDGRAAKAGRHAHSKWKRFHEELRVLATQERDRQRVALELLDARSQHS